MSCVYIFCVCKTNCTHCSTSPAALFMCMTHAHTKHTCWRTLHFIRNRHVVYLKTWWKHTHIRNKQQCVETLYIWFQQQHTMGSDHCFHRKLWWSHQLSQKSEKKNTYQRVLWHMRTTALVVISDLRFKAKHKHARKWRHTHARTHTHTHTHTHTQRERHAQRHTERETKHV